jgi:hypothetical protein
MKRTVPCFEKQKNSEHFKTIITSINKIALQKHQEYWSGLRLNITKKQVKEAKIWGKSFGKKEKGQDLSCSKYISWLP